MKKYDLYISYDVILAYIGRRKSDNIACYETICYDDGEVFNGVDLEDDFPKYNPIVHRKFWGYSSLKPKLLEKRNGVKPTLEYIRETYCNK